MPTDPATNGNNSTTPAERIAAMVLQFLTMVMTLYIATLGNRNQDKIERVEQHQQRAADRSEEVKKAVENKAATDAAATEIQLWSAWKYLDSLASESGDAKDRVKANDAKKTYEDSRAKRAVK